MHPDLLRIALRAPGPARILEIADEFFLLRIHRDHRLARGQGRPDALVETGELRVAIGMSIALAGLAIALQTELLPMQQRADQRAPDTVALGNQRPRQLRQALARPTQRRHRIAARVRLDQRQQIRNQCGILRHPLLAAAAATTHTPEIQHVSGGQFLQAATDRAGRDPGRTGNRRDPPIPRRLGFRRCEDAPGPLVQMGPEGRIAGANRGDVDHPLGVAPAATKRNPTSPYDPLPDSLIRGGALSWTLAVRPDDRLAATALADLEANQAALPTAPRATGPPEEVPAAPPPRRTPIGESSSGTGFFVTKAGHVATNAHVVEGCNTLRLRTASNTD